MTADRVLVTGAGGFCGAVIARSLAARGYDVVGTIRPGSRGSADPRGVALVECDLDHPPAIAALVERLRPDRCVHAAAAGARARCDDLDVLLRTNVRATAALVEALASAGATRLVTLGSSSEYGPCDGPMAESAVPAPDDLYGVSKLAAGLVAHAVGAARGIETLHLRLFSVYGPGEAPGRLVASVVRAAAARVPLDLTGGAQVRDFVYVGDVADAVAHALVAPASAGTYNVGTGVETRVRDLALLACRLAGADPALLRFGALAYRADERFAWRAETATTAAVLGWKARTSLEDGLSTTLAASRIAFGAAA